MERASLVTQSISGAVACHSCPRVDGAWTGHEDWDVGGELVPSPPLPPFLDSWVLWSGFPTLPIIVTLSNQALTFVCSVCPRLGNTSRVLSTLVTSTTSWHCSNPLKSFSLKIPFTRSPFQPPTE